MILLPILPGEKLILFCSNYLAWHFLTGYQPLFSTSHLNSLFQLFLFYFVKFYWLIDWLIDSFILFIYYLFVYLSQRLFTISPISFLFIYGFTCFCLFFIKFSFYFIHLLHLLFYSYIFSLIFIYFILFYSLLLFIFLYTYWFAFV